jgi:hypothetical protein
VLNEINSRYGSGWTLAGIPRIYRTNDGKNDALLVSEGNGVLRYFELTGCSATQCQYRSPEGDFSSIVYNVWSDVYGQYVRTYPDGTKVTFAGKDAGTVTATSDRFGRTTTLEWRNTWETQNPVPVREGHDVQLSQWHLPQGDYRPGRPNGLFLPHRRRFDADCRPDGSHSHV